VITPTNNTVVTVQTATAPTTVQTPAPVTPVITPTNNTVATAPTIGTPVTATPPVTASPSTNIGPVDNPTESLASTFTQANGLPQNVASSRSTANHKNRTASSGITANSRNKITPFEILLDNFMGVAMMDNDDSILNMEKSTEGDEELPLMEELAEGEKELPLMEESAEGEKELPLMEESAEGEKELPLLEESAEKQKEERPCKKIVNKHLRDDENNAHIKVFGCIRKETPPVSTQASTK
jgi:hypothetical protein